eukprot:3664399-Prymnesium_polylepis.1
MALRQPPQEPLREPLRAAQRRRRCWAPESACAGPRGGAAVRRAERCWHPKLVSSPPVPASRRQAPNGVC